jgi:hypothetical protein
MTPSTLQGAGLIDGECGLEQRAADEYREASTGTPMAARRETAETGAVDPEGSQYGLRAG